MFQLHTLFPLFGTAALSLALTLPGELKLKEADHKNLGKLVGSYFTALDEEKGIFEALKKVLDQVETMEKRMKGEKLLAAVGDWEQVFRLVTAERLVETLKKKGEVTAQKLKEVDANIAYSAPKKAPKGALPLILVACDLDETPVAHLNTHWNDPALRESAFLVAVDLGKDPESWSVFNTSSPSGPVTLMKVLGQIQREFPVDMNRRFLAGSGKGFLAAEATATTFPYLFAGLVGIGDTAMSDLGNLVNFRNLPTLFLKGGEGVKAIEAKMTELGYGNCKAEPEGTVANAVAWMTQNARNPYPAHISFAPKIDSARQLHWASLVGTQSSENPSFEAKADRASNTITIDASKVGEVILFLNDELLDLGKPVQFVINGTIREQTVERNPTEMIRNQRTGDWGRVFSAIVTQDIPPK